MARIRGNLILSGVSGAVGGQVVIRQTKKGPILAAYPSTSSKKPSAAQLAARARFRLAVQYATGAAARDEYKQAAAKRGTSAFAVARSDFLNPPRIDDIDVSRYRGLKGDRIEVTATDDLKVVGVTLRILSSDAKLLELGEMTQSEAEPEKWSYVAGADAPPGELTIEAAATDLAGNRTLAERKRGV